ncbi:hypothetical protein H6F89_18345 [Cyanobacteria bacterium FACHB-63]|nr:hypothetical protein [Cyanobacteria bacterium FACHB-63]
MSGGTGAAVDDYAMSLAGAVLISSPQPRKSGRAIAVGKLQQFSIR